MAHRISYSRGNEKGGALFSVTPINEGGAWQIGLIVQVVGKADVFIAKISIKLELMAAIARKPPPDEKVEAVGQAKIAGEVEICWFLTISVEYDVEYREELSI